MHVRWVEKRWQEAIDMRFGLRVVINLKEISKNSKEVLYA